VTPGQYQQHGQPADPAPGVGDELETRGVGEVQVLERQQQGRLSRRPGQELDDGLAELDTLQPGICGRPGPAPGALAVAERRGDPDQVGSPGLVIGWLAGDRGEVAERVGPDRERRGRAWSRGGGGGDRPAARACPAHGSPKLLDETGLADAALAL